MLEKIREKFNIQAREGIKTLIKTSHWAAAFSVGLISVGFAEIFEFAQEHYFHWFQQHPYLLALSTPFFFVAATALVVFLAPAASGSGIPQVLKTLAMSRKSTKEAMNSDYVSLKTAGVKMLSATVGLLGGASIGREGPTIQISTSLFTWVGTKTKAVVNQADFHSYMVAGAAAGVSAAFNTPLAGIAFVIEELADGTFSKVRQTVLISVIIAGVTAQALLGNYLYFGYPSINTTVFAAIDDAIWVGLAGGVFGGILARMLAYPIWLDRLNLNWWQKSLFCGVVTAGIALATAGMTTGTGYEITKSFMNDPEKTLPLFYPFAKILATFFSYASGMAGGIFAPSLSIGAGLGSTMAQVAEFADLKVCGLLGMAAFFTGVVQAPITAVIIVMEMTDQHSLIIPLLLAAFIASGVARMIMPRSLYHFLAQQRFEAAQQMRLQSAFQKQMESLRRSTSSGKGDESKGNPGI